MTAQSTNAAEPSLIESIDKLFLQFLVGENKAYKEVEYNDSWLDLSANGEQQAKKRDGWNQRILLDVEKDRAKRVAADKEQKKKRNALLMHYFQQLLLKVLNEKLADRDHAISDQLQLREANVELLQTLLAGEPHHSLLVELLELDIDTRKRLITLANNNTFIAELGHEPRIVSEIQTATALIGTDVLRYLVPAIIFKSRINTYSEHNVLFAKKLWRYEVTLGQTCTALMIQNDYHRPYEGMLLSAMINLAFVASYQQYIASFDMVRMACLDQAREKGKKERHDFFYEIQSDSASLKALLVSQSDLKLSLALSEKLFSKSFPHLVNALREEVEQQPFSGRSEVGQVLFQAVRFAKYDQLRSSRLFKDQWLNDYLQYSQIDSATYKKLLQQELFRFKPIW